MYATLIEMAWYRVHKCVHNRCGVQGEPALNHVPWFLLFCLYSRASGKPDCVESGVLVNFLDFMSGSASYTLELRLSDHDNASVPVVCFSFYLCLLLCLVINPFAVAASEFENSLGARSTVVSVNPLDADFIVCTVEPRVFDHLLFPCTYEL